MAGDGGIRVNTNKMHVYVHVGRLQFNRLCSGITSFDLDVLLSVRRLLVKLQLHVTCIPIVVDYLH